MTEAKNKCMNPDKANLANATIHGTFWAYASTYSSKLMALVSTTILARLLLQEDFGIVGYALVVMGYLEIINGLGIVPALIYHPKDSERTNNAFWLGLGIGVSLFVLAWFIAPLAGIFFNDVRAIPVTRVLALAYPISALFIVHEALLRKDLAFKLKAIPDFTRAMSKGLISIALAIMGFGVWSLIFGQLTGVAFSVIAYWRIIPWRPSFRFNPHLARSLLSYGLKIVSVRALSAVMLYTDYLLVGRFLGTAALGVYTLAFRVPNLLIGQFADVIGQVLFPLYAKTDNDPEAHKRYVFTTIRYVSMITVPIGLGLALAAKPFVLTFFTEKWTEAIPIVVAISVATVLDTLIYNLGDLYKAQGRPEILAKLSFVKAIILIPALWWAVTGPGTLIAVGWTVAVVAFIGMVIQFLVARQILQISFIMILKALCPAAIGSTAMASAVLLQLTLCDNASPAIQLTLAVSIGAIAYMGILWWVQREVITTAVRTLRKGMAQR